MNLNPIAMNFHLVNQARFDSSRVQRPWLAMAVCIGLLGLILAGGAACFPVEKGYSILGPQVFPMAVAVFLILLGAVLAFQAVTGRRNSSDEQEPASRSGREGACWVTGGLLAMAALIGHLGFVLSAALLFAMAARGFGSRRSVRDLGLGIALTLPVYWIFTAGLGVSLPVLVNAWI